MKNILKLSDLGNIPTKNSEFITLMFCKSQDEGAAVSTIQKVKSFSEIKLIYGSLAEKLEVFKIDAENDKVIVYITEI